MPQKISNYQFYFDEPRLRMTLAGRSLVRIVRYVAVLILIVATFTLLLSYDIRAFLYIGLFLLLMVLDLVLHRGDGDIRISTLRGDGARVNLAATMSVAAYSAIERAVDRSAITKRNFLLELASRLFELPIIENSARALEVPPQEFRQKLDALMGEPAAFPAVQGRDDYVALCERLAARAFAVAVSAGHDFIQPSDLFAGLPAMGDESLDRLFALFSIDEEALARALIFSSLHSGFIPKGTRAIHRAIKHRASGRVSVAAGAMGSDATNEVEVETALIHEAHLLGRNAHISISFSAIARASALAKKHGETEGSSSAALTLLKGAITQAQGRGEKIVTAERVAAVSEEKQEKLT